MEKRRKPSAEVLVSRWSNNLIDAGMVGGCDADVDVGFSWMGEWQSSAAESLS